VNNLAGIPAPPTAATKARVLVVDDEANILELLRGYLEREGYDVACASDGAAALRTARDFRPDVVVLDIMLPGLDGIEVCRQLRQFSSAYVLMLTAKAKEMDKIVGLTVGADDYMTKPFSPRELVARVRAMLRRSLVHPGEPGPLSEAPQRLGALTIDRLRRAVAVDGREVSLTAREFDLLAMLAEQPGRVFTRVQILDRVWGSESYDEHAMEVHIGNLRRKLGDDPSHPRYLETVRGVGYRALAVER
jgi:DNA-binding response OmpR family regulator